MLWKNPVDVWRTLGIRTRLAVGYAATLSLLLFVYAVFVYAAAYERLSIEVDHRLDQEVEIAERSLFVDASHRLIWRPSAASPDFQTLPNMLWIDVHRADASLLHRSLGGYARGRPVEPLAFEPRPSGFFSDTLADGTHLRILQRTVEVDGEHAIVRVAYDEEQIRRDLAAFLLVLAIGIPLAVLAAGLTGYWLAGRALVPVARMTAEARAITAEHLDVRLPVPAAADDLQRLATTFNDLFARLERSFEQLRRFTADASHELRTPLTVIRSVGEVGLREPHSETEYRDIIGTMLEEVDRLTLLTTLLLEITRAEGGRVAMTREPIDLRELVEDAAGLLGVLAEEGRVRMERDLPAAPVPVRGDWTMLRQALVNLLDNAIKHSPPDAVVAITCRWRPDAAEIGVADQGPGIPAQELPHIFERFHRVDAARSRTPGDRRGGFGLGLAIARQAVEAHGGRIEVESEPGRGSRFRIVLPPGKPPNPQRVTA
ncbi:sensor histidine kinase [Azospira restricta]|uniref:histidine kinase n=1 Tax=Azospira restricta TaxID=404405 RepID=A0A974SQF4_9RHOO|nr:ATP-binding protein [Azospira restricta]QRJ64587.1 HAMP domain-containing protein [Azospira restricta]